MFAELLSNNDKKIFLEAVDQLYAKNYCEINEVDEMDKDVKEKENENILKNLGYNFFESLNSLKSNDQSLSLSQSDRPQAYFRNSDNDNLINKKLFLNEYLKFEQDDSIFIKTKRDVLEQYKKKLIITN